MVTKNIRKLGSSEADVLFALTSTGKLVFTLGEAESITGKPRAYLNKLFSRLVRDGWLIRLERGKFYVVPLDVRSSDEFAGNELLIASCLAAPYYLSFRTALGFYEVTEQISRTVYVVSTQKKKRPRRTIQGLVYQLVTVPRHKFFGFAPVWISSHSVNMAEKEKVIVDGLDAPHRVGGLIEVAKAVWHLKDQLDWSKIVTYAEKMQNGAISKRLGFLLESFGIHADIQHLLHLQVTKGISLLDPTAESEGRFDTYWNLRINVPEAEVLDWRRS